ncbi:MAG: hypothetical protein MJ252_29385 [archaeon]|nr:hypothetical protein [archaeon]
MKKSKIDNTEVENDNYARILFDTKADPLEEQFFLSKKRKANEQVIK